LIDAYVDIDVFSQGKHTIPLGGSPRNMGKNDIWIASVAKVLSATLVSTDKDFEHLTPLLNFQKVEADILKNM
jgi:tRNA(fMet)-specific endonuclease VapC